MNNELMTAIEQKIPKDKIPEMLYDYLRLGVPADLYRINIKRISNMFNIPLKDLVTLFLRLVQSEIFNLNWDYHCPHCKAIPGSKHRLAEMNSNDFCPLCDVTFRNTLDENIEVTFTVSPNIMTLPPSVEEDFKNAMFSAAKGGNFYMPVNFLSGLEFISNPLFHEIFEDDVLPIDESLEIKSAAILFTDIKGSTQMYTDLGDAASYKIVKEHYKILFRKTEENNGFVVKTIGDAVMSSFISVEDAIKAAVEAHKEFKQREWNPLSSLEVKMGIHTGSVIVVNLNDAIDYFGNTVNTAARIEGESYRHSICFSKPVLDAKGVKSYLKKLQNHENAKITHRIVSLKRISEVADLYTLTVA